MDHFKQALALMREEKLYSAMYIAGTALAIAFTMLIAEVYYVKVADIAPEVRRSSTYYLDYMPLKNDTTRSKTIEHETFTSLFQTMKTPDCITGVTVSVIDDKNYMKLADGLHDRLVNVIQTEPGFFQFYQYRFVQGKPFTQDDFDNERPTVVITEQISDLLFGKGKEAIGQTVRINNLDYHVCGVVETPSALMEKSVADIWCPYSAKGINASWGVSWRDLNIEVAFSVPASKRDAFMQEIKEIEARYNSVHKDEPVKMAQMVRSHYSEVWDDLGGIFSARGKNLTWYVAPAILLLLLVPALNMSGMVASRMERRLPEMAIRKAFGAKRRTLIGQVITENFVLTLFGGVIGLCLAWTALYAWRDWVFYVFSDSSKLYGSVPIVKGEMIFGPAIFLIALLVGFVLNVLAAALPAWISLRKPIVESMMIKK